MSKKRKQAPVKSVEAQAQETPSEEVAAVLAEVLDDKKESAPREEPAPEPSVEVEEDTAPTVSSQVAIVNLDMSACYVPVQGGSIRLGPKASKVIDADDVTEETRQLVRHRRIQLRNL